jgi:hypothetical protein
MMKHLPLILFLALALALSGCSRCGKARASADVEVGNVRVGYSDPGGRVSGHPHGGPPGLRNHPHGGPPGQMRRAGNGGNGVEVEVEVRN